MSACDYVISHVRRVLFVMRRSISEVFVKVRKSNSAMFPLKQSNYKKIRSLF